MNNKKRLNETKKSELKNELRELKTIIDEVKSTILNQLIIEGVDDPGILKCVFMSGGPGCFVAGTKVKTENGYENIEDIIPGTMVYTINEDTREIELKPVLLQHTYDYHTEDLLELEFEGGVIVRCTENHKFYIDGKWVCAKDLIVE